MIFFKKKLPEKLWKCIMVALKDLRKCEKSDFYHIEMGFWHEPNVDWSINYTKNCAVCFAGAVMAKSLKASPHKTYLPSDFSVHNDMRLRALNDIRSGEVWEALVKMGYGASVRNEYFKNNMISTVMPRYSEGPELFKAKVLMIAMDLKKFDL